MPESGMKPPSKQPQSPEELAAVAETDLHLVLGSPDPVALRAARILAEQGERVAVLGAEPHADLPSGVQFIVGDLAHIDFGLSGGDYAALLREVRTLTVAVSALHFASDVQESLHVRAAVEAVEFVRAGGAPGGVRFLSSLLVFGNAAGPVQEDDFEVGQLFADNHEEALAVAEKIIRRLEGTLPLAILRTGPVVGDEETREIYPDTPLATLARGIASGLADAGVVLTDLPARWETVDRAAACLVSLMPERAMVVAHLVDAAPFTDRQLVHFLADRARRQVRESVGGARVLRAWARPQFPGRRAVQGWGLNFSRRNADRALAQYLDRDDDQVLGRLFPSRGPEKEPGVVSRSHQSDPLNEPGKESL